MTHVMLIGTRESVGSPESAPELLSIDREIDRPYKDPPFYNSLTWSRRLELPWVLEQIGAPSNLTVLDIGSGISALPIYLSRHGAKVVSVDPERPPDLLARTVATARAMVPRLPFRDKSFDVVTCVSVLEHLPGDLSKVISELERIGRKRVIVTFDVAFGPLARVGLSTIELKAFAKRIGREPTFPDDPLTPAGEERRAHGLHLTVCLLSLDLSERPQREFRLSRQERILVYIHRLVQREVRWLASVRALTRKKSRDSVTHRDLHT